MQEWFNWHAWKACVPQKGTGGSNPPLSAKAKLLPPAARLTGFLFLMWTNQACLGEDRWEIERHYEHSE
jgi:hypothetical protein